MQYSNKFLLKSLSFKQMSYHTSITLHYNRNKDHFKKINITFQYESFKTFYFETNQINQFIKNKYSV
jgi:hypothetical protein